MRFVVTLLAVACSALGLWAAAPTARAATPEQDCAFAQDPDDAIRACNEVIGRNPRDATALSNRGVAYAQKGDLDTAIAWVEDRLLGETESGLAPEAPMALREMEVFSQHQDDTLIDLEARMEIRRFAAGEVIYDRGANGDELFWVRRGTVRLIDTRGERSARPLATFGRGDFFGGLAFLDHQPRPNTAVAVTETEVYVLSRPAYEEIAKLHKKLAFNLAMSMASIVAARLRRTEARLATLQE